MAHPDTPNEDTAKAALSPGKLIKQARLVTESALDKKLLEGLKVKKIGTWGIESKALGLALEAKKTKETKSSFPSNNESRLALIRRDRDPSKVVDVLNLKIGYARQEEESRKKTYRKTKKHLEQVYKERGKERKFRKIIARISEQNRTRWDKGTKKIEM